jgi:hypothetical protein
VPRGSQLEPGSWVVFAATLLSAPRLIENTESSKPKLNEQYFVDEAIKKAAFILERIDKAFPSDG